MAAIRQYRPDAILRGRASASQIGFLPMPARRALDTTVGAGAVQALLIVGALLVLTGRSSRKRQIAGAAISFAASKLSQQRNPYGRDGSDQMAGVIAGYRIVTAAVPDAKTSDDLFLRAVNLQTGLAYLTSGLAKAISSKWRAGDALGEIVETDIYGGTWFSAMVKRWPSVGKLMSWTTIVWETAFPLVYFVKPGLARLVLTGVKGFHLGVAAAMGLPRFLWGFSSAHVAVQYVIEAAHSDEA
jgi:hypothetical protein